MKPTFRILAASLLLSTAVSCTKKPVDPAPTPPPAVEKPPVVVVTPPAETQKDMAIIDGLVIVFMDKYDIPGASLAISKDGKLVYRKGYGLADKAAKVPVTVDSRFRLASVSMTYTGVAIMKLVEEGKFKLDDKVFGEGALLGTKYGRKPYSDDFRKITVRNLLLMTAGGFVTEDQADPINLRRELKNEEYFNWLLDNTKLAAAPGTAFRIANTNYFIAGRIVEKFSGKRFIDYVKDDLLKPIGDTSTELAKSLKSEKYEKEVTYYAQGADVGKEYGYQLERYDASTGLLATATDVLRFVNAIDGLPTRPDILNKTSMDLLTTPSSLSDYYAMGLGVSKDLTIRYSNGVNAGVRTFFMHDGNGMSAVLLMNGSEDYTDPAVYKSATDDFSIILLDLVGNPQRDFQKIDQF